MPNTDFEVALMAVQEADTETSAEIEESSGLKFEPNEFINSLQYMGKGMLGILIVMSAIILVTMLLNRLTSSKKESEQDDAPKN